MKRKADTRPKAKAAPPMVGVEERPGAPPAAAGPQPERRNPKLGAQARKLLGKHYASKYQTMRRG